MILKKHSSFIMIIQLEQQLNGSTLNSALKDIFERITQDIFNESLAKW